MFHDVLRLIVTAASKPVNNRDAFQVQEDVLHILNTLRRYKCKPWRDGLVEPAIRFVESSAWSLLWLKIRFEHGWPGSEISAESLASVNVALQQHFDPILEESRMDDESKALKQNFGTALQEAIAEAETTGNTRLQNLICMGIPVYNIFAAMEGWPTLPLPAFCTVPTP